MYRGPPDMSQHITKIISNIESTKNTWNEPAMNIDTSQQICKFLLAYSGYAFFSD